MTGKIKKLVVILGLGFGVLFVVFIINQSVQVVSLARALHPIAGEVVKYLLLLVYFTLLSVSLYYFIKLPKPLVLPWGRDSKDYDQFLVKIASRLKKNKILPTFLAIHQRDTRAKVTDREALEGEIRLAEKELDRFANQEIKTTAQAIFVSTAISQSGSLDSIVVLVGQVKMIWRIARIYNQRPGLRELIKLYSNVGATSFAARAIEDLDFAEIIEPMVHSFSGSGLLNLIPIVNILSNSLFSGTANALLTLRTGIIARQYCGMFSQFEARENQGDGKALRKYIRISAIKEAGKILGSVIVTPSQTVTNLVLNALKKSKDFSGKMLDEITKITKEIISRVSDLFKKKAAQTPEL